MKQKKTGSEQPAWPGGGPDGRDGAGTGTIGAELWIGRHTGDQDTLVFDPAESDGEAEHLSFYSLTQHRTRTFPRPVVMQRIRGITDDIGWHRAKHEYDEREARREELADAAAAAHAERMEQQRQGVIEAHRRYLDRVGVEYRGVEPTPAAHKPGRRTKCQVCGIALDDFASSVCEGCNGVLCSCGACACRAAAGSGA